MNAAFRQYGFTVTTGPDSIKEKILNQVKSNGLSYALFYCGFLADLIHVYVKQPLCRLV